MQKTPSLSDLEYFLRVLSEGSLTSASQKLRVQQSTLTMAVQRLERITATALLVRTRSGIRPTQAGKIFAIKARALLENWNGLQEELQGKKTVALTRFSFACHQSTGFYTLKHFLPAFLNRHPQIELTIRHDYTQPILADILGFRLDFGLTVNPTPHPDLQISPLYTTYLGLWGSAQSQRLNPGVLLYDPQMYGLELIMPQLQRRKLKFERTLAVSGLDTIASLVVNGGGQAILPADTACSLGPSPLRLIWEPRQSSELQVSLVYRKDLPRSPAAQTFIDSIETELSKLRPGRKHRAVKQGLVSTPLISDIKALH